MMKRLFSVSIYLICLSLFFISQNTFAIEDVHPPAYMDVYIKNESGGNVIGAPVYFSSNIPRGTAVYGAQGEAFFCHDGDYETYTPTTDHPRGADIPAAFFYWTANPLSWSNNRFRLGPGVVDYTPDPARLPNDRFVTTTPSGDHFSGTYSGGWTHFYNANSSDFGFNCGCNPLRITLDFGQANTPAGTANPLYQKHIQSARSTEASGDGTIVTVENKGWECSADGKQCYIDVVTLNDVYSALEVTIGSTAQSLPAPTCDIEMRDINSNMLPIDSFGSFDFSSPTVCKDSTDPSKPNPSVTCSNPPPAGKIYKPECCTTTRWTNTYATEANRYSAYKKLSNGSWDTTPYFTMSSDSGASDYDTYFSLTSWFTANRVVPPDRKFVLEVQNSTGTGTCEAIMTSTPSYIPTCNISVNPNPISQLFPTVLSWSTDGVSATIDNGIGSVAVPSGSMTISGSSNTDSGLKKYTMITTASDGATNTCHVDLTINQNTEGGGGPVAP